MSKKGQKRVPTPVRGSQIDPIFLGIFPDSENFRELKREIRKNDEGVYQRRRVPLLKTPFDPFFDPFFGVLVDKLHRSWLEITLKKVGQKQGVKKGVETGFPTHFLTPIFARV